MEKNCSVFETLFQVNVNEHIEKKRDLSYLSWTYAWADISFLSGTDIKKDDNER